MKKWESEIVIEESGEDIESQIKQESLYEDFLNYL